MLLVAQKLKKEYGIQTILEVNKIEIAEGDRIGLVGRNGVGKSTLLKILSGEEKADEGVIKRDCEIAMIRQSGELDGESDGRHISQMGLKDSAVKSGGEKTRHAIAAAFSKQASLLFADEPTTNLDMAGVELLEKMMWGFSGAIVMISHDREFLDHLCDQIWELEDGEIRVFPGNYSDWVRQKERERKGQKSEYEQYQKQKKKLEKNIAQVRQDAGNMEKRPRKMSSSEWLLYKGIASQQQTHVSNRASSMSSRLEQLDEKEKPKDLPRISMKLGEAARIKAKYAAKAEHLTIRYDGVPVLEDAVFYIPSGQKTFLTGTNGAGKSTLIHAIMEGFDNTFITSDAKVGYFSQEQENLRENKTVLENVMEDARVPQHICRAVLKNLYMNDLDIDKKVSVLSGGERVKTALAKVLVSDTNFLILDEPTNHMDIYTMEGLEDLLKDYDGTLLVISHDRKMIEKLADEVYEVSDGKVTKREI